MREEELGMAEGAEVGPLERFAARVAQRQLGRAPEVELPLANDGAAETCAERLGDVRADLVAARADRRAHGRREPAAAERSCRRVDDPREQAAPADVQDGE